MAEKKKLIPKEVVDQIVKNTSIGTVISAYSPMKLRGKNFKTKCPFCSLPESLVVSPAKNIYKCFSCKGGGGNSIQFIQKVENLTYPETLRFIQSRLMDGNSFDFELAYPVFYGTIFLLKLEKEKYFIGFSYDYTKEIGLYMDGKANRWINKYKVLSVVKTFDKKSVNFLNYIVEKCVLKYGYENVRGGDYTYFEEKYLTR